MNLAELIGYISALFIGLVMGLLGSGGSILSVPVFAYIFSFPTLAATTYSLFVVGITSTVGTIPYIRKKTIELNHILYFGIASVLSVISVRTFILPHLPEILFSTSYFTVKKDSFVLVLFAILMSFSAYKMIKKNTLQTKSPKPLSKELLIIQGVGIGTLTGFIGAGGGFLIIPALVLILGLDMKKAIGTSLCLVAINSLIGFFSSLHHVVIDWKLLLVFTLISVIGIQLGTFISSKINSEKLKPLFGWFLIIIGTYIIIKEIIL